MHSISFYCQRYEKIILLSIFLFSSIQIFKLLPYQLDDAYITYHYAQNFIKHGVFTYNFGQENTEGFTSFFWFLSASLFGLFNSKAIHLAGPVLGYLSYCMCFTLVIVSSKKCLDKIIKALLLAFLPTVLFYSVTGLETVFFAGLIATICLGLVGRLPSAVTLVACLIVPWVRPEAPWLAVIFIIVILQSANKFASFKKLLAPALVLLISQFSLLLVRFYIFNDFLPNTYYEKEASVSSGISYLVSAFSTPWLLLIVLTAIALSRFSQHRVLIACAFAWLLTPLITGSDWMDHFRFLLPALLLFILSINTEVYRKGNYALVTIIAASVMCSAYFFYAYQSNSRSTISSKNSLVMIEAEYKWLQRWLNNEGVESVALIDIGKFAYNYNFEVLDLGGLTDKTIAKMPGKHMQKTIPVAYILARKPGSIIIRLSNHPEGNQLKNTDVMSPAESDLALDPLLHEYYQIAFILAPAYQRSPFYASLVLIRRELTSVIAATKALPLDYSQGMPFIYSTKSQKLFLRSDSL